jgi:cytoskeleton protein RodZ
MMREGGGVGIGARLRAARERRGLTVLQAAEKLHVDARVLEALEAENFEPLGADVYARGHLRRYADLVGESPRELQDLYANASPAVRPDLTRIPRGQRPRESQRLMLPALLTVMGLALAGLLWWLLTLPGAKPHALPPPPTVAANPDAATPTDTEPTSDASTASASTAGLVPGSPRAAAVNGQTLTLKFSGASWVQIADAHGRVLLDGLQPPGGTRSVSGTPPLRVVLGNAPAVALEINGRPASLQGLVRRRGDARFSVDAAGAVSAVGAQPGHGD